MVSRLNITSSQRCAGKRGLDGVEFFNCVGCKVRVNTSSTIKEHFGIKLYL